MNSKEGTEDLALQRAEEATHPDKAAVVRRPADAETFNLRKSLTNIEVSISSTTRIISREFNVGGL